MADLAPEAEDVVEDGVSKTAAAVVGSAGLLMVLDGAEELYPAIEATVAEVVGTTLLELTAAIGAAELLAI